MAQHPYYPPDILLSGTSYHRDANSPSAAILMLTFVTAIATLLLATLFLSRRTRPHLGAPDQALVLWFVMSE